MITAALQGSFFCSAVQIPQGVIVNRESLIDHVDSWVRIAAVVASYARGDSGKGFMTPAEMSESLQLRWFMSNARIKVQVEHNRGKSKGDFWLGGFNLGGIDPYLLVFRRTDTLTEEDMAVAEEIIKKTFHYIRMIRCHFCEGRLVAEEKEGEYFCVECLKLLPLKGRDTSGYVYVFGSKEKGYYKIGQSAKPDSRLRDYQLAKLPFPVEMIHTIPVDDKVKAEASLHHELRDKRENGEWFKVDARGVRPDNQPQRVSSRGLDNRLSEGILFRVLANIRSAVFHKIRVPLTRPANLPDFAYALQKVRFQFLAETGL